MELRLSHRPGMITIPRHLDLSSILRCIDQAIEGLVIGMIRDLESPDMLNAIGIIQLGLRPDYDEPIIRQITVSLKLGTRARGTKVETKSQDEVIVETSAE